MNKKIAVIYKTKYGSTKRYAGWIKLKLDADLYEVSDIKPKHLSEYDIIIFGGGLYLGKIKGINFIKNNYDKIRDKELYVFTVGMESISEEKKVKIIESNFKDIEINDMKLYTYKGAFEYKRLNLLHKILIGPIKRHIDSKNVRDLSEDDKNLLKGFSEIVDLTDKKSIDDMIDSICATK